MANRNPVKNHKGNSRRLYAGGRTYAVVSACVGETTATFITEKSKDSDDFRKSLGAHVVYAKDLKEYDDTLAQEQWDEFAKEEKQESEKSGKAIYNMIWIKRRRLVKSVTTIVGLHGNRARFITVTTRHDLRDKKDFLYAWENLRKELKKKGYPLGYTGMLERQDGKRRKDKIGRMVWHFHAAAYLANGGDWNYKEIQRIAVRRGFNIDFQEFGKAHRTAKKIGEYTSKLSEVVKAAYIAKMETGEDYVYTDTSKGCDLPKVKRIYNHKEAFDFIDGYGFRKESGSINGFERFWYKCESEAFGREIYDSC